MSHVNLIISAECGGCGSCAIVLERQAFDAFAAMAPSFAQEALPSGQAIAENQQRAAADEREGFARLARNLRGVRKRR